MQPEHSSTTAHFRIGNPGELEGLVASQFRHNDVLQMRKRPVIDLDRALSRPVKKCTHFLNIAARWSAWVPVRRGLTAC